ncbi:nitroreductase [Amorphus sp. MBR-141]
MTHPATADPTPDADAAVILDRLLRERYSCRRFRPDPVPRDIIVRMIEMAGRSASWCNVQPWHVTIVEGERLEILSARLYAHARANDPSSPDFAFPAGYSGPRQARRRECGYQLYDSVGITRGDREAARLQALENFRFFGAPHTAILTSHTELGPYGAVDCGAFIATFLLAARSLGVDAIAQAAVATYPEVLKDALGLADDRHVICAITFGHADEAHPANAFRTRRADIDEIATWRD